ncbi:LysE family translocator [Undibacterium sp. RuRC25W]|uniref:LysE family translocator n=1 Tax=Undibacterium sp. RuRC25W TaxID=3413047 RepID=UPI003BF0FB39
MSHDFLLAVLTYLIATASPGPSNLALMTVAMNHGRRVALAMACGIISGSTWWGAMAVLGFAGVLQTYAEVLVLLKVLGAAYLFWLALISLRRVFVTASTSTSLPESRATFAAHYQRGLKLHLSNPKAIFTWLAIASLSAQGTTTWRDNVLLLLVCVATGAGVFFTYAVVFSTKPVQRCYLRWQRLMHLIMTLTFGLAAGKLLAADE